MKRIILSLTIFLCFSVSVLSARDVYRGEVQIQGGIGLDSFEFDTVTAGISSITKSTTSGFTFDISMFHHWFVTDIFGLGFFGDLRINGGQTETMTVESDSYYHSVPKNELDACSSVVFSIGPNFAAQIKGIVQINTGLGIAMVGSDTYFSYKDTTSTYHKQTKVKPCNMTGVYFGTQAKFLPNKRVSPVVGCRIIYGTSDDGVYWDGLGYAGSAKLVDGTIKYTATDFYAAVAINW